RAAAVARPLAPERRRRAGRSRGRGGSVMAAVSTTDVLRIRAALSVGVPPAEALSTVTDPALAEAVRAARLGRPLSDIARSHRDQGAGAQGAGPILRALA